MIAGAELKTTGSLLNCMECMCTESSLVTIIKRAVGVLDFRKAKNTRLAARVFLRFFHVSQHPACLDHVIQKRKTIRYFFNPIYLYIVTLFCIFN